MNIFERASRAKLRFQSTKGFLSTEDLWDLSMERLDTIAKTVNRQLRESAEESFIEQRSNKNTEQELSLEILKHVIASKLADRENSKRRAEASAQRDQLVDIIQQKKNSELANLSVQELEAKLQSLQL